MKRNMQILAIITLVSATNSNARLWDTISSWFTPNQSLLPKKRFDEQGKLIETVTFDRQGRKAEEVRYTPEGPVKITYTYYPTSTWERIKYRARKYRDQKSPDTYPATAKRPTEVPPYQTTVYRDGEKPMVLGGKQYRYIPQPGAFSSQAKKAYGRTIE